MPSTIGPTRGRPALAVAAALVATLAVAPVAADEMQQLGDVAHELARSLEALRGYTWKSRVEVSVDGEVTQTDLYDVTVDEGGALRRTLVESEGEAVKAGEQAERTLSSIRQLIDGYIHMSGDDLRKAFGEGARIYEPGEDGLGRVRARDVFASGDETNMWYDATDLHLRRMEIRTVMQQQPCRLTAEFHDLEDGLNVVTRSVFEIEQVKKKGKPTGTTMTVVTENSDHRRAR
jgi:hypothetical protein